MIQVKRIYEKRGPNDGFRILVDRIWPRGMRRDDASVDLWLQEIAPSTALRRWFGHDPTRWEEFKRRYFEELSRKGDLVEQIRSRAARQDVTLLYAARDEEHNNAVSLRDYLAAK